MKIRALEKEIRKIFNRIIERKEDAEAVAMKVHKSYRLSAKNLYRYLILRSFDLRKVHDNLSDLGTSSLRTAEGYVFSNLYNVIKLLRLLQGKSWSNDHDIELIGYQKSKKLLRKHANQLFNERRKRHFTEIMVTLPTEAAEDKDLIRNLIKEGMEIARINLSHDNEEVWKKMIKNIHSEGKKLGVPVKIYMDLSGPKIRTSQVQVYSKKGKIKQSIKLRVGDHLILTKRETLGKPTVYGHKNELIQKAEVGVAIPEIIDDLKIDDYVYFDDGVIKAVVISKNETDAEIVITEAYKPKLSSYKGINLPNTKLNLPSLTRRDMELLPFVCKHADILGYSFVRTPKDVARLYRLLKKLKNNDIGVVFKIENEEAFDNLPLILFEGMKRKKIGVMIARGDLAVEIGFERISEVQNQILWLCEAAHVPVIWATQVLENLAKTGMATRAEVTDAAQSAQAECVMLNKGPHITEAVRTLKNILIKMESHSSKKKSSLRSLKVATEALKKV
jgi:pyruvate kinase